MSCGTNKSYGTYPYMNFKFYKTTLKVLDA